MRIDVVLIALFLVFSVHGVAARAASFERADPRSDAPEARVSVSHPRDDATTYAEALQRWRSISEVNDWVGAHFEYDRVRALALSETQRGESARVAIHTPEQLYARPTGICVDLARFVVETLRVIDPARSPRYLMIEFDPIVLDGSTLRRHWVVVYEEGGRYYVTGDSKRPGHVAGPYASVEQFVHEYARYRGRAVVAFSERSTYERRMRTLAVRRERSERVSE